jgi:hypothetical protein
MVTSVEAHGVNSRPAAPDLCFRQRPRAAPVILRHSVPNIPAGRLRRCLWPNAVSWALRRVSSPGAEGLWPESFVVIRWCLQRVPGWHEHKQSAQGGQARGAGSNACSLCGVVHRVGSLRLWFRSWVVPQRIVGATPHVGRGRCEVMQIGAVKWKNRCQNNNMIIILLTSTSCCGY